MGLLAQVSPAQTAPKVSLDSNEALFTALAAMNACGYDAELAASDPLRAQIRAEVAKAAASDAAKESTDILCQFYSEHQQKDPARTLAQQVSLALFLTPTPELSLKVK